MPNNTYDIILTGATLDGAPVEIASRKLATLFNISEEKARAIFAQAPLTVKKNISEETAKRFEQAFAQANIKVRFQGSRVQPPVTHAPSIVREAVIEKLSPSEHAKVPRLIFKTEGSKAFGFLSVVIPEGQTLWVDSTSVVSSDAHISLNSHDSSIRRLRGNGGIYISEYTSRGTDGEIGLSPSLPGEIVHILLDQQTVLLKNSAFLASAAGVALDEPQAEEPTSNGGDELRCHGGGDLWLQVCGSVLELEVTGHYCVKFPHLVAWTEDLTLESSATPLGNDLINVLGHGKIWLQSQTDESLVSWAAQFRQSAES